MPTTPLSGRKKPTVQSETAASEDTAVDPSNSVRKLLSKLDQMIDQMDPREPNGSAIASISKALQDLSALHARNTSMKTQTRSLDFVKYTPTDD